MSSIFYNIPTKPNEVIAKGYSNKHMYITHTETLENPNESQNWIEYEQ